MEFKYLFSCFMKLRLKNILFDILSVQLQDRFARNFLNACSHTCFTQMEYIYQLTGGHIKLPQSAIIVVVAGDAHMLQSDRWLLPTCVQDLIVPPRARLTHRNVLLIPAHPVPLPPAAIWQTAHMPSYCHALHHSMCFILQKYGIWLKSEHDLH